MNIKLTFCLLIFSTIVFGQVNSETRKVGSFESIKVGNAIDVRLLKGNQESIRINAEGVPLSQVKTTVSGGMLKIGFDQFKVRTQVKVYVEVTYVSINQIEVSTAADLIADQPIKSENLELKSSTASSIEIPVDTDYLLVEAATASDVILSGNTKKLKVIAETSSNIDASQLKANQVTAEANTASGIRLYVIDELNAEARTAASIRYRGNPARSNANSNTGGNIKHVD